MESRLKQLSLLHSFVEGVDKDLTMILQNLQWDRKRLLEDLPMVPCRYNNNHKLPLEKMESHETKCFMKFQGYSEDDELLPEPVDNNANTLVKLSTQQIFTILNDASRCNPLFKRGNKWESRYLEPWSLERLQATYTADERRAIHDAVVQAVPSCHDLADLALPSYKNDEGTSKVKSRVEILAELRDMKRRRPKYRMAAKTRNFSDVLRDVIQTQMEFYSETSQFTELSKAVSSHSFSQENKTTKSDKRWNHSNPSSSTRDMDREEYAPNKEVRCQRPNEEIKDRHARSKYYKSPNQEMTRYSSYLNTAYNSKSTQISGNHLSERHKSKDHRSPSREKLRDREYYKSNDSMTEKRFENKCRQKHTLPSHRINEYKEYRSSDRLERKTKKMQIPASYRRKRNRESGTSYESEDSRTSDIESRDRRKRRRRKRSTEDRQSRSSHNMYSRSRMERMHMKSERSDTSGRHLTYGRTATLPGQTNNSDVGLHTYIKQEKNNSPDIGLEKQIDYGYSSRPICNTNSGTSALIKVEKAETLDSQYSYSRAESDPPSNTKDENEVDNITIKKENVDNTDKRIRNRQEQNGHHDTSTYKDRHVKIADRGIVYLERSSEKLHGNKDGANSNREKERNSRNNRIQIANNNNNNNNSSNVKNVTGDEQSRARHDRYGHRSDQRHRICISSASSSSTTEQRHDSRKHEKYNASSRDTIKNYREKGDYS